MQSNKVEERKQAIARFQNGEQISTICRSMRKSRKCFYLWWSRFQQSAADWYQEQTRRPHHNANQTTTEIEENIKIIRLELYNQGMFCGAQAIAWRMEELGIQPIPSIRTIGRVLVRADLTYRRTGRYEPSGVYYPRIEAKKPNEVDLIQVSSNYRTGFARSGWDCSPLFRHFVCEYSHSRMGYEGSLLTRIAGYGNSFKWCLFRKVVEE